MTRARACILLLALAGVAAGAVWLRPWGAEAGRVDRAVAGSASSAATPERSAGDAPLRILHAWDTDRARAYAAGRPQRLRDLYVAGSSAGRADVALLRRYRRRGLHVSGMRTQVLSLAVLEHRADLWRLRVTDRLVGAVAVGHGRRTALPRDRPSEHEITLLRTGESGWRVGGVREAG